MTTAKSVRRRPKKDAELIAEELCDLRRAIDRQTENQGKWLAIIARFIAALTPGDDPRIAELTAQLKASSNELQQAVEANQPK